ncbi:MAG: NAD(P)-dependent alcohol dehydrogenase [Rhodothermales bacterium]
MNAWSLPKYGRIEDLGYGDYPKPTCEANNVLVKIKAAALNPADLKLISGKDGGTLLHAPNFPLVPGYDFSGVVEEVGEQVRDLKKNQEVFGFLPYAKSTTQGALGDYLIADANTISPKPANVSHEDAAAAATTGTTALIGLRDKSRLKSGQHVLINGASGGVGSFAVQIARQMGASVWGTSSDKNLDTILSLGAEKAIDYKKTGISDLSESFDVFLDASSTASFHQALPRLNKGGTYVTLLPSATLATGILRSLFSSRNCRFVIVKPNSEDLAQLAAWMAGGQLKPLIGASYPMKEAQEALRHLKRGCIGKIVLTNA